MTVSDVTTGSAARPSGPPGAADAPHLRDWEEVASALVVDPPAGLDDADAAGRLTRFGENRLAEPV